jgi:hypothetical protein
MRNRFKIYQKECKTYIFVGEKQIPRVRSYQLSQSAGEIPILTLEIMPDIKQIELDGEIVFKYYDVDGNELALKK